MKPDEILNFIASGGLISMVLMLAGKVVKRKFTEEDADNARAKVKVSRAEGEVDVIELLRDEVKRLANLNEKLAESVSEFRIENEQLRMEISSLKQENIQLRDEVGRLKNEIQTLNDRIGEKE